KLDNIGSLQLLNLLVPLVRLDDIGPVLVVDDSCRRDRVLPLTAYVLAGVQPLLDGIGNGFHVAFAQAVSGFWKAVIEERLRFLAGVETPICVAAFGRLARVSDLKGCAFATRSFSDVCHSENHATKGW